MGKYPEALAAYDETIERFKNNVVAYCGRAEILKEMGKYPEALAAYDETIERFENDRHARNGLAVLLILLERALEVPSLLNIDKCISKHDWRDLHVAAMSYLRSGNLDKAVQQLEYGFNNSPFFNSKGYFASALAYAKIKKEEYKDIQAIFQNLPETHNRFEAQKRHLFLTHSKAALNKKDQAISELALIPAIANSRIVKLKDILDKRYCISGHYKCPAADDCARLDQIIEDEELFLAMAIAA
jgi:tetratricopeptide (TPR) repeat protein